MSVKSISPSKREVTRNGQIFKPEIKFGTEERFSWQKPKYLCDVVYDPPNSVMTKSTIFGTETRKGMDDINPDNKKRSNGPGSYEYTNSFNHNSEYVTKRAVRFAGAPRESMALKTPSPGAVYNITKQYYNGYDTFKGISFSQDKRKPLGVASTSADADMLLPKLPPSRSITIAKRITQKFHNSGVPGPIYDVHVRKLVN